MGRRSWRAVGESWLGWTSVRGHSDVAEAGSKGGGGGGGYKVLGMCRKLCEDGAILDAVQALDLLVQRGCHVPSNLLYRLLKRCIQNKDLASGRCIHALTVRSGYEGDAFLATHLVGLYALHGRLQEAMGVFAKVPSPDAYNWATIISAHARHGEAAEAIRLYRLMCTSTAVKPDYCIYSAVLKACVAAKDLVSGKEVHSHILASSEKLASFFQARLVNMYAKCGCLDGARRLFDELPDRNVATWTAMIAGYVQLGMGGEALSLYSSMQQDGVTPNAFTYACLLQACASVGVAAIPQGKQLHANIEAQGLQKDVVLGGTLVNMYAKCGSLEEARVVFDGLSERTVVTWTAMISGYAQRGMGLEAISLYSRMRQEGVTPNSVTYVCLLQACASVGASALQEGKQLHAQIEEQGLEDDVVVGGSLVNMYAKCGNTEDARRLFNKLPDRNVVAWNAMIAGYVQEGMGQEALSLYSSMKQEGLTPDSVTYVCLLQACAIVGTGALDDAKQLHAEINERGLENDVFLGGSLVNMYVKCNSLGQARRLFDKLPNRNIVAWNTMIAGYVQEGTGQEALNIYSSMQQEGVIPDTVTYLCLLQACGSIGVAALPEGKHLHAKVRELGLEEDVVLGSGLVNMYVKCGSLDNAQRLLQKLPERSIIAWTAMIAGYAQQGMGEEALRVYSRMQQDGLSPDLVTYVCLLQACAGVGLCALDEGKQLHARIEERGLQGGAVLGGSLVNMYAKCGSLDHARNLFDKLPDRNVVAWTAMIAGYAQQGMAEEALSLYNRMQEEGLTPNSVTYVCLLQACAAVAALPLGEQLHAKLEERGMQADENVVEALVNMYSKCGRICDAQRVFDSLSDRSIEAWNALVGGYARNGDSQAVFDLLGRMTSEGLSPNEITFLSVLSACSHVGLVDKGRAYFEAMRTKHGMSATMEHYICMVDLLGRAGHLHEALQMAKDMPFPPNDVMWHTLLGACWKWKNVEIGQQAFKGAVSVDEKDAAAYVLMSNIYASTQMWDASNELKARRMKLGAWKKPGQSWWTDMEGVVHTFLVGDVMHPESESIYSRLEQLISKMSEGYGASLGFLVTDDSG